MQVDVIIPTYRPGSEFRQLISKLQEQEYPIHKIIIINSEVGEFPQMLESEPYQIEVTHIRQEEFDHGGTRNMGASISQADIVLYMTQDAFAKASGTSDKELYEIPGATHIKTYYVPEYVNQEVAKLSEFFGRTLK